MKVLFLFNTSIAKYGSFEDLLIFLAREIKNRNGQSVFAFPSINTPEIKTELEKYAKIYVVKESWESNEALNNFKGIIKSEKPDVLNTHFCEGWAFFNLYLWCRLRKIKVIFHYHGEIPPLNTLKWYKRFVSYLRFQTLPVNLIITVSNANAAYLKYLNIIPPIKVVYNGINFERFILRDNTDITLKEYGLNPGEKYLCYVGSLIARKRIDFLLTAFKQIHKNFPNLKLVVAGGGEIEKFRQLSKSLSINDFVIFTGLLKEYPYELVQNAYLLVTASKQESFGLILAEAMSLNVPVVACRVGGIPEVVKDGEVGLLADSDDINEFANHILKLLNNGSLRESFSKKTRDWVTKNFDLKEKVNDLINIFFSFDNSIRR